MVGWRPCHVDCGCIDEDACVKAPKNQPYPCPCPDGCNGCDMVYENGKWVKYKSTLPTTCPIHGNTIDESWCCWKCEENALAQDFP